MLLTWPLRLHIAAQFSIVSGPGGGFKLLRVWVGGGEGEVRGRVGGRGRIAFAIHLG